MLKGYNGAAIPSGEQIKLRIGIPLREGGGMWRRMVEMLKICKHW